MAPAPTAPADIDCGEITGTGFVRRCEAAGPTFPNFIHSFIYPQLDGLAPTLEGKAIQSWFVFPLTP